MSSWENYHDVLQQMAAFGIELKEKDSSGFPKRLAKRVTCGQGGKDFYKLYEFERNGRVYLTGSFGTYRHGGSFQKVEVEWAPLSDAERSAQQAARQAQIEAAAVRRREEVELARASAVDLWRRASASGASPYLERKGLTGESCRFLAAPMRLRWPSDQPSEDDTVVFLPEGTLVLPLIRYDFDRSVALRALQFIKPDGQKVYLKGFEKPGCALRLGEASPETPLVLVCEGYATGLSVRLGVDRRFPVFVAWDAGNLVHVVPLVRSLYPNKRLLICADDDWKTFDRKTGRLNNPGRTTAKQVARDVPGCDLVWPVFTVKDRGDKDTDFDDLRQREGLHVVRRQLGGLIRDMGRIYG
jgi:putative DNA primase/helicase